VADTFEDPAAAPIPGPGTALRRVQIGFPVLKHGSLSNSFDSF